MTKNPKFRAFYCGRMYDVKVIDFRENEATLKNNTMQRGFRERLDDLILMQSTGRFDKKGEEIFEDDVLSIFKCRVVIKRDEQTGGFVLINILSLNSRSELDISWSEVAADHLDVTEIIGNIHDEPELEMI